MTVVGDPAGMRALADLCAGYASRTHEIASSVQALVKTMGMTGPYAVACGIVVSVTTSQLHDAAQQLDDVVRPLRSGARQVEDALRAEAAAARRAAEAAEAARADGCD